MLSSTPALPCSFALGARGGESHARNRCIGLWYFSVVSTIYDIQLTTGSGRSLGGLALSLLI